MQVTVKFFASLSEQTGITELTIETDGAATVMDIWNQATTHQRMPSSTLCAINMTYARSGDSVHDGDEIAFFPPVTGGQR
jgi:molybdopterin synthase sulfur carrier subunit